MKNEIVRAVQAYCEWADSQAKNKTDLLVLGLGPILLFALLLTALPAWLAKVLSLVALAPALYIAFVVLRAYAKRGK
jgi:hypothetical protein